MLDNIRDRLPAGGLRLDPRLGMAGLAAAAALLAAMVVYWLWRDSVGYRALYGAHEAFPAADVLQVLDGEGVDYRLHPQTGQVLVREADLAATRLLLSAKGVQVAVPPGYELFDREEPLGSSQFVRTCACAAASKASWRAPSPSSRASTRCACTWPRSPAIPSLSAAVSRPRPR